MFVEIEGARCAMCKLIRFAMHFPIHFDDEFVYSAITIEHEKCEWILTPIIYSGQLSTS